MPFNIKTVTGAIKAVRLTLGKRCMSSDVRLLRPSQGQLPVELQSGGRRYLTEVYIKVILPKNASKADIVSALSRAENEFMKDTKVLSHRGWDRQFDANKMYLTACVGK
jgi:hypothetical protein